MNECLLIPKCYCLFLEVDTCLTTAMGQFWIPNLPATTRMAVCTHKFWMINLACDPYYNWVDYNGVYKHLKNALYGDENNTACMCPTARPMTWCWRENGGLHKSLAQCLPTDPMDLQTSDDILKLPCLISLHLITIKSLTGPNLNEQELEAWL